MRTTLTIEDSTVRQLNQIAHETGKSYKQVVDETFHGALAAAKVREPAGTSKLNSSFPGGPAADYNLHRAPGLAGQLEEEENMQKIRRRKCNSSTPIC